jgi:hypothetical protein
MAFGFAGAHRTGKTTLAKKVAEDLGWFYHDASVSKIMREAGINAVGDVPIMQRIEAQEFLLKRYLKELQWASRPMVTDRTPLDMIGYMLGEITMHNNTPEVGERVYDYMMECLSATITQFDTIILVRPLATYTVDPKSPPLNRGYQAMVQLLVEGAASMVADHCYIEGLEMDNLQERISVSKGFLFNRMTEIQANSKAAQKH